MIDREVTLTRIFDAPRTLVFAMWTDPRHVAQWWGPQGFSNPVCEMDVRSGGALRIVMRAPDGVDYPMRGSSARSRRPNVSSSPTWRWTRRTIPSSKG